MGQHGMRLAVLGVDLDGSPGKGLRLVHVLAAHREPLDLRLDHIAPGVEGARRLAVEKTGLGQQEARLQRPDDALSHLVLDGEDVVEIAVVLVRPNVVAAFGVDELGGDSDAIARLAHAAFQDITNAEVGRHLAHIGRLALVGEGGVARDDEQTGHRGQQRDDVLGHAVGEILLFGVAAHIVERQHGDGWFPRRRGR